MEYEVRILVKLKVKAPDSITAETDAFYFLKSYIGPHVNLTKESIQIIGASEVTQV